MSNSVMPAAIRPTSRQLAWQVGIATLSRLSLNTSRRFPYAFAPALGRGLGVPLTAITSLIAINQATGVFSPFFGPLSDRWGYRFMMLAGLMMFAVGMLTAGLLPFYGVLIVAVCLAGLGKSLYDPALHAYVGERVPYERRGLVIGMIEFSWAGSSLVGIPLAGLFIEWLGWQSPFLILGGLGLVGTAILAALIPVEFSRQSKPTASTGFMEAWRELRREPAALSAVAFGFLATLANDNLFVIYGVWLEDTFALSVALLGAATIVIGVAELIGEILTASIADRLGLKRAVIIGLALTTLSYLLLPSSAQNLPLALTSLFAIFLIFEFTIVTSISLFTEVVPAARATLLSACVAASGLGRFVGALIGGPIWLTGGLIATSIVSAAISGLALACLLWGLRSWRNSGLS